MPKTHPRTESLSAVGELSYTVPAFYDNWRVTAIEGGSVTADSTPLAVNSFLVAGQVLTFTPATPGGTTTLALRLSNQEFSGVYSDLDGLPANTGGGLDTEAVQDIVAAMLGNVGNYNDAAGTYTITLPQPRTDEEIQDVVAALIQAGANITKTYDDAGNVLTLSASGGTGGGGGLTSVVTDGTTITGDGTEGNPLVAHLTGGARPISLRFVQGVESNIREPQFSQTDASDYSGTSTTQTIRMTVSAEGPLNIVQARATIAYLANPSAISLHVYDGTGTTGAQRGALLATATAEVQGNFAYSLVSWALDTPIAPTSGQQLVFVWGETATVPNGGQLRISRSNGTSTYFGMTLGGWFSPTSAASGQPYLRLLYRTDIPKGVVGPLDPLDVPRVSDLAALPNGGQALYTGVTPPQWYYRDPAGTLVPIGATGGGTAGSLTRTSAGAPAERVPTPGGGTADANYPSVYRDFTPSASVKLAGIRVAGLAPGVPVGVYVYQVSNGALIAKQEGLAQNGVAEAAFTVPADLIAGTPYRIGWSYMDGANRLTTNHTATQTYQGFTVDGTLYYSSSPGSMPTAFLNNTVYAQMTLVLSLPATVTGLPAGYLAMSADGVVTGINSLPVVRRMHVDVIDAEGNIKVAAAMGPGETWAYTP